MGLVKKPGSHFLQGNLVSQTKPHCILANVEVTDVIVRTPSGIFGNIACTSFPDLWFIFVQHCWLSQYIQPLKYSTDPCKSPASFRVGYTFALSATDSYDLSKNGDGVGHFVSISYSYTKYWSSFNLFYFCSLHVHVARQLVGSLVT